MKGYFPFIHQRTQNSNVVRVVRHMGAFSAGSTPSSSQSPHTPSATMSPSVVLSPLSPSVMLPGSVPGGPPSTALDPWSLLEEWDDTPLALPLFGGMLAPRRQLTYASAFFEEDTHISHSTHQSAAHHVPDWQRLLLQENPRKRGWEETSSSSLLGTDVQRQEHRPAKRPARP